jgi:hypothetical protein
MNSIAKHNPNSMMALHLPHAAIGDWTTGIEERATERAWKAIKTPIVIGTLKPTGYSPTWAHKPLSSCQTFSIFKLYVAPKPTHNAWAMYLLNPKGPWRSLWSDLVVLKDSDYKKKEIVFLV